MEISSRLILTQKDKVLLTLRKNSKYAADKWMLPGGKTDSGETALESIIREAKEELAVSVRREDLIFAGVVHWDIYDKSLKALGYRDGLTLNWATDKWSSIIPGVEAPINTELSKCYQIEWFSGDEIQDLVMAGIMETTSAAILEEFVKGKVGVYVECDWERD